MCLVTRHVFLEYYEVITIYIDKDTDILWQNKEAVRCFFTILSSQKHMILFNANDSIYSESLEISKIRITQALLHQKHIQSTDLTIQILKLLSPLSSE